jgi:tripartite-type tricarboxylate transporter receptor subunit TctC
MLNAVALFVAAAASLEAAHGQYPDRQITVIVPLAPGSAVDLYARMLTELLRDRLGQQLVVLNRPGAEGRIGIQAFTTAAPDGYTLMISGNAPLTLVPAFDPNLPWEPVRDIAPIAMVGITPFVLTASPKLGVNTMGELIELLKKSPGSLNASIGGPAGRFGLELFKLRTGTSFQIVPYNGDNASALALIRGDVDFAILQPNIYVAQAPTGKITLLAIAADKRVSSMPDAPTAREGGVDWVNELYVGIFARAGTPKEVLERINKETLALLQSKDVAAQLLATGMQPPDRLAVDEFTKKFQDDVRRTKDAVIKGGLKLH